MDTTTNALIERDHINITKPHSNIDLVWSSVSYQIKDKTILNEITGYALHGQITAIMGSSGAGKTSLLNALSCRLENSWHHKISGSIFANDVKLNNDLFGKIAAYVMQQDILMETLTPKECFLFAANLKLDLPINERTQRVKEIISELKLEKCQDTKIGNALEKGISGGEKRRVSIGVELIADPSILFLDGNSFSEHLKTRLYRTNIWIGQFYILCDNLPVEETGGVQINSVLPSKLNLKSLGRNIIFTIHQPSSDIFKMFDRIIFLSEGKSIYQGKSLDSIPYFDNLGFKCPIYANPADFLMEITHLETPKTEKDINKLEIFNSNYEEKISPEVQKEMR